MDGNFKICDKSEIHDIVEFIAKNKISNFDIINESPGYNLSVKPYKSEEEPEKNGITISKAMVISTGFSSSSMSFTYKGYPGFGGEMLTIFYEDTPTSEFKVYCPEWFERVEEPEEKVSWWERFFLWKN